LRARLAGSAEPPSNAIPLLNSQVAGTRVGCWLRRLRPVETQSFSSWIEPASRRPCAVFCRRWWTPWKRFQTIRAGRMSSVISHRAGRSRTRVIDPPEGEHAMLETPEILYTAEATASGRREGHAATSDGRVDVELDVPKEMGARAGLVRTRSNCSPSGMPPASSRHSCGLRPAVG
jgi:hypothetical protein